MFVATAIVRATPTTFSDARSRPASTSSTLTPALSTKSVPLSKLSRNNAELLRLYRWYVAYTDASRLPLTASGSRRLQVRTVHDCVLLIRAYTHKSISKFNLFPEKYLHKI